VAKLTINQKTLGGATMVHTSSISKHIMTEITVGAKGEIHHRNTHHTRKTIIIMSSRQLHKFPEKS